MRSQASLVVYCSYLVLKLQIINNLKIMTGVFFDILINYLATFCQPFRPYQQLSNVLNAWEDPCNCIAKPLQPPTTLVLCQQVLHRKTAFMLSWSEYRFHMFLYWNENQSERTLPTANRGKASLMSLGVLGKSCTWCSWIVAMTMAKQLDCTVKQVHGFY